MKRIPKQISTIALMILMVCALSLAVVFNTIDFFDDSETLEPELPPLASEPAETAETPWLIILGAAGGAIAIVPLSMAAERMLRKA